MCSYSFLCSLPLRLEIELEEDVDLKMDSSKDGPHLKVAEGILESASSVSPILPQRVVEELLVTVVPIIIVFVIFTCLLF